MPVLKADLGSILELKHGSQIVGRYEYEHGRVISPESTKPSSMYPEEVAANLVIMKEWCAEIAQKRGGKVVRASCRPFKIEMAALTVDIMGDASPPESPPGQVVVGQDTTAAELRVELGSLATTFIWHKGSNEITRAIRPAFDVRFATFNYYIKVQGQFLDFIYRITGTK